MIRILHTADWHLGQTLRGHSREAEHRAAFAAMRAIIVEREVDALVVAGDVFDTLNPSGESTRLLYETLAGFAAARPGLRTVLTAGNHDAAGRLEAAAPLFAAFGIEVVGNVRWRDGRIDGARHLVSLRDAAGRDSAEVLAVSYPTATCLPPLGRLDMEGDSPVARAVADLYARLGEATRPWRRGLPLIATGHLHVQGGEESEGAERRILVGGQHAAPLSVFPEDTAYVALGHLHKPHWVQAGRVRYAGSLFPLSATELVYRHGVTLLTGDGDGFSAEHIALPRPVPFLRLPAGGEMRAGELADHLSALALPPDLPPERRPFVQVRLAREGLGPGFREEIDSVAARFPVRLVDVRLADAAAPESKGMPGAGALARLAERDPEDLFRLAFERQHSRPPGAAHLEAFHRAAAGS
jgi:exonuclease SbcD